MNIEASRLRTFKNWPANAVVDARRIAKAGFYYMGQGLEVQCFSCGGRISEWNYGDKVMTRHRWLDPRCPFVVNPTSSGNVPIEGVVGNSSSNVSPTPPVNDRTDSVHSPPATPRPLPQPPSPSPPPPVRRTNSVLAISRNLRVLYQQNELARLNSFEDWPKPYIVTPESLARAGFYYTRDGDTVKCAFCDLMVGHWEEGDDPFTEHMRHYPSCSFLISNGTVPPSTNTPEPVDFPPPGVNMRTPPSDGESVTVRELGVQFHKVPKHPKYSMHDSRLQTFVNWPGDVVQTPEDLAAAGFYYAGSGDQVKCFHCDGGLRMWDPQDDPWIEHARWYPLCGYIVLVKGQPFIDNVLQHYPPLEQEELDQIERDSSSNNKNNSAHPPRPNVPVSEGQLQELMNSPEAVAALQVGLEFSRVKTAVRQRAEMGAAWFNSPEALINAALDVQLEETLEPEHSELWGTPPSSPVNSWRRRHYNNEHLMADQTQSENTSDGNTTETEDVAEYPPRISESQYSVPVEPTTDEEDNIGLINNEPAKYQLPTCEDAAEVDKSLSTQLSQEEAKQKVSLEEENRRLKEARLCKICMDKEISVVFLPCGHLVTCVHCAHSLADCPVCREEIKATVRTFLS